MEYSASSLQELRSLYHQQLFDDVLPFWLRHSIDQQSGGYFTSLNRSGAVFDTDKFIWLQSRQVWTFARMYNTVRKEKVWLDTALHGSEFLKKHGRDSEGNWYFSLDRAGHPLVQPYNIFSDCFAAMAFGQIFQATQDPVYQKIAYETFPNILARQHSPKGKYDKTYPGTRPLTNFALPMILCNLVLELESVLEPALVESTIDQAIHQVMEVFYQPDILNGVVMENVTPDGRFSDSYDGRLLNPGHVLEAMWFIMDLGIRKNDRLLIDQAVKVSLNILAHGWDQKYGGLFYFLDVKGHPPQQLEWDQKLWWVHLEAMVATLKGYALTGNASMWDWFVRIHDYSQALFPDPEFGEWYGYLNRRGEVLLPLKGGKWKGCFHVPRGLYQIYSMLDRLDGNHPPVRVTE